jgi:signal transduction histidine kinase
MAFARPQPTERAARSVSAIVNEAMSLATKKHNLTILETTIENLDNLPSVHVDSRQIVTAVSHILSNALESYSGGNGPITITGKHSEAADAVELTIRDQGYGMDSETLRKAMLPFFSAKHAGRKRGMGLSLSQRLILLSGGTIRLDSEPDVGTAISITLPCR